MTTRTERTEALAFMVDLLEMGVEYPDAQYQTTISYDVEPQHLQADYDELCLMGGQCHE